MTKILCDFFDWIGSLLNSLLPNLTTNGVSNISDSVAFFVKLIGAADYLFPVSTLFQVIGIVVAYKLFMMGLWLVNWLIRTIRG